MRRRFATIMFAIGLATLAACGSDRSESDPERYNHVSSGLECPSGVATVTQSALNARHQRGTPSEIAERWLAQSLVNDASKVRVTSSGHGVATAHALRSEGSVAASIRLVRHDDNTWSVPEVTRCDSGGA